jgi:hypothetical protein
MHTVYAKAIDGKKIPAAAGIGNANALTALRASLAARRAGQRC